MIIINKKVTNIFGAIGITIFPFVFLSDKKYMSNKFLINHESIHYYQEKELMVLPFYILYLINFIWNLLKYRSTLKAYENIIFEKESYDNELDMNYLLTRKKYAWLKYLFN